ncbi:hypothetical protein [Streptomyces wuyuanensis]|uniref:hypothetical protein n=1 Tax=Streptomyces wuyuanensis TaxID=1196353 RepID=UPI003427AC7E
MRRRAPGRTAAGAAPPPGRTAGGATGCPHRARADRPRRTAPGRAGRPPHAVRTHLSPGRRPPLRGQAAAPWLLAGGLFAAYATVSVSRYHRLETRSWDLGVFEQAVRAYAADLRPRARYRLVAAAAGHVLLKRLPGRAEGLPGQWTATAPAR